MQQQQTKTHAKEASSPVEVAHSPTRCPYCHDACGPDDEQAVVCQACLSRHHGGCWREGGGTCASCGSTRALRTASVEAPAVAHAELALLQRGLCRQAVERLSKRKGVSEAVATTALLEAAARELDRRRALPPGAIVAIVAIVMIFSIPILAMLLGR